MLNFTRTSYVLQKSEGLKSVCVSLELSQSSKMQHKAMNRQPGKIQRPVIFRAQIVPSEKTDGKLCIHYITSIPEGVLHLWPVNFVAAIV